MEISWEMVSAIANCVIALAAVAYTVETFLIWRTARRSADLDEEISMPLVSGPDPAAAAMWSRILARQGWSGSSRFKSSF